MADIVERLRNENSMLPYSGPPAIQTIAADTITALRAENERLRAELHTASDMNAVYEGRLQEKEADNERLRAYALKAFTVVEFCCGEGLLLETPFYDCDDLILEGVNLLNVETSEEARAALEEKL